MDKVVQGYVVYSQTKFETGRIMQNIHLRPLNFCRTEECANYLKEKWEEINKDEPFDFFICSAKDWTHPSDFDGYPYYEDEKGWDGGKA